MSTARTPDGAPLGWTDRYQATGTPYPDPDIMCQGDCDGMGCVPVYDLRGDLKAGQPDLAMAIDYNERDPELVRLWEEAEARRPTDDGWHFVVCPACQGTRLRPGAPVPDGWPAPVTAEQAE